MDLQEVKMTTRVKYTGQAFVRGWKPGEERELPAEEAKQYNNPRAKALGFKVLKKTEDVKIKSILKGGKHD
jgi:hypothetical protein